MKILPIILKLYSLLLFSYAAAEDLEAVVRSLNGQVSIFFEAVNTSGVLEDLQDEGPYTIFAPNDDACQNYSWPTNETEMVDLIRYHIVKGNFSIDLLNGTMETLDGNVIVSEPIDIDQERIIAVNDAYIVEGDHYFNHGVLQIISKVLDPTYQNEANQDIDGDDQGSNDNGANQGQQLQKPPYNGYNEAARPPYQPRGYGPDPYQAQSPTGFSRNDGLGLSGFGTGFGGNNVALGNRQTPLRGGMTDNGVIGNNRYNDRAGELNDKAGHGELGQGFPQFGDSRNVQPRFQASDEQEYGQEGDTGISRVMRMPAQNGDDQEARMPPGLPVPDSDPIVSRRSENDDQSDGPAAGLDSWGQPTQGRSRSHLDNVGIMPGPGLDRTLIQNPAMTSPYGQHQQQQPMTGSLFLQTPMLPNRIPQQHPLHHQKYQPR